MTSRIGFPALQKQVRSFDEQRFWHALFRVRPQDQLESGAFSIRLTREAQRSKRRVHSDMQIHGTQRVGLGQTSVASFLV